MIRFFVICGALLVGWGVGGCASLSTADLLKLDNDNAACVQNATTKAGADACRAKVNAAFCAAHPGKGTMCAKDGGAE